MARKTQLTGLLSRNAPSPDIQPVSIPDIQAAPAGITDMLTSAEAIAPKENVKELVRSRRVKPRSVALKIAEQEQIEAIAQTLNVSVNSVMTFAIRRFLDDYRAGRIDLTNRIRQTKGTIS